MYVHLYMHIGCMHWKHQSRRFITHIIPRPSCKLQRCSIPSIGSVLQSFENYYCQTLPPVALDLITEWQFSLTSRSVLAMAACDVTRAAAVERVSQDDD